MFSLLSAYYQTALVIKVSCHHINKIIELHHAFYLQIPISQFQKLELLIWNWSYNAKCYCINKKHERYHTNN